MLTITWKKNMDQLQLREREIFNILKVIKKCEFVVIGGYAVNAYALPRFSIDCDIIVSEQKELDKIIKELLKLNYKETIKENNDLPYHGKFYRYGKTLENNFKVSMDILFNKVLDRQTNATFESEWIINNSSMKILKGKTINEELKIRIINIDALITMKMISCRNTDIRDIFMLIPKAESIEWIKEEVSNRYLLKDRIEKIKETINSKQFKDNLQGVHGYIEQKIFDKHKKAIEELK